ncbi:MAG: hypothetical protein CVU95_13145 [Firmicutes bacterium HGW-Firmicutes-2]|jgi:hypothetical protein|uniref:Lipoprotein n=1 Tax=Petrocella atlantisensis TaxID=2173034 RepID=A0A3P7PT61_9FIRM|nr:hypothetical protein [Petrocella atlantisensis]PKM65924.1 MAG: hypothetical protein CVU95_13145 [Firmicutes bacterium HGW-Firmicutes-2]VDN47227.1 conserved protein of unknown function [Petrocella atlantisensis]
MIKKIILTAFSAIALVGLTACNKLDVIGDQSIKSFDAVLNEVGDNVNEDTSFGGWSLEAPDGAVRFVWSQDFSKTTTYDAYLELDAQPFIDAGLDTSKLSDGILVGDKLILGTDFGSDALSYNGEITPLASYKKIVELYRNNITYHMALDHFGVDLKNGNMLEWAKDMTTNDKDIVFVLNPEVFINAGVDPNNVEGWVFAKVPTMDEKGNDIEVDKLLKPFDFEGNDK